MIRQINKKIFKVKRKFITLIEMMIVMFLIALIAGVLAYNFTGSLDEGKVFKTRQGIEKVHQILELESAKNPDILNDLPSNWEKVVSNSSLVKDPNVLTRDGWGQPYEVRVENNKITVRSSNLEEHQRRK